MRTKRIVAVALAAGVVGAGAVVTPMVLAADEDPAPYGPRWDEDGDSGRGRMQERMQERGMGPGMMQGREPGGNGGCPFAGGAAQGTLTESQKQTLAQQAEKEKLSHDVYVAYFESTGDYRFERVAASEEQHLQALRMLMNRYDVTDPTEGLDEGEFRSDSVDEAYDAYLGEGDGLAAALKAAQEIEEEDIAGLDKAAKALEAPDAEQVYEHLTVASQHHLEVFSR
jgi:hypothetical protein